MLLAAGGLYDQEVFNLVDDGGSVMPGEYRGHDVEGLYGGRASKDESFNVLVAHLITLTGLRDSNSFENEGGPKKDHSCRCLCA